MVVTRSLPKAYPKAGKASTVNGRAEVSRMSNNIIVSVKVAARSFTPIWRMNRPTCGSIAIVPGKR